mgnify:CR=1 FL=1
MKNKNIFTKIFIKNFYNEESLIYEYIKYHKLQAKRFC